MSKLPESGQKIDKHKLAREFKARVKEIYPYFLGFYIICLLIAVSANDWRELFYWPALHISFLVFTLIFISAFSGSGLAVRFNAFASFGRAAYRAGRFVLGVVKAGWLGVLRAWQSWSWSARGRAALLILVPLVALWQQASWWEVFTLIYAAWSIIYILDSRIAAAVALVYLAACPLLLWLNRGPLAESAAVYAFYFLVITVLTQLRELRRDRTKSDSEV